VFLVNYAKGNFCFMGNEVKKNQELSFEVSSISSVFQIPFGWVQTFSSYFLDIFEPCITHLQQVGGR
jgi:hypothetical protein